MTVKNLASAFRHVETLMIVCDATARAIDPDDAFLMDAYGDYVVNKIYVDDDRYVELHVAMRPMKAGEVVQA